MPASHRLAGRSQVSLDDLAGQSLPRWPGAPAGGPPGPEVHDLGQLLHLVALRRAVAAEAAAVV